MLPFLCSVIGTASHTLSTSGQGSAATGSPASCAIPVRRHSTEACQQDSHGTLAELPAALPSVSNSPGCNDSTAADQHRRAQQDGADPVTAASSMGASASAHQVSNKPETASNHNCRATQPSMLAEVALMSMPPAAAAQQKKDLQSTSSVAMDARTQQSLPSNQHSREVVSVTVI
jgi:hypothetical protein